ncbi:MAG: ABC transporter permease [Candidatus Coatesbacteria bacterium]
MNFRGLAFNNILRSRTRSLLTILSIATASVTLTVVLALDRGYQAAVDRELVSKSGVHLYITKEGCPMEAASIIAQGGISPLYVPASVLGRLATVGNLDAVLPFNIFALTTSDGTRTDIFTGVTPALRKMRPDLEFDRGGWFEGKDPIILGAEMARLEKRAVGDKIYFEQLKREFRVVGILKRTYGQDDGMFFLPLEVSQALIDRQGKLSAVAIKVKDVGKLATTLDELRALLPGDYYVMSSKELGAGVLTFFGSTRVIMFVTVIMTFLVSIMGIVNTKLMTIAERKREFAYLKCVGATAGDIMRLVSLETGLMGVIGAAVGGAAALVLSPLFEGVIRRYLVVYVPTSRIVEPGAAVVLASAALVVVVSLAASVYPAARAARIRPMEVLRDE